MVRDRKPAKRPYTAPSFQMLDATAAKAELEAKGEPQDQNVRQMLSLIDEEPNSRRQPKIRSR
jgi:hypothetical protein